MSGTTLKYPFSIDVKFAHVNIVVWNLMKRDM